MHDAGRVSDLESIEDLEGDPRRVLRRQPPLTGDELLEGRRLHKLHDDVDMVVVLDRVVHRDDPGM